MNSQAPPDTTMAHPEENHRSWFPPSPIDNERRLSMTLTSRVFTCGLIAFVGGGVLAGYQGSKKASLRFRAENSHRFPTTTIGWYLYHKSKNYKCMLGAIKEGIKGGSRLAGWSGSFFFLEEAVDHLLGSRNCASTVIAGLTMSGIFSIKNGFNIPTIARAARTGLYGGLGFGLAQDMMALARGRRVAYVDAMLGKHRE